jgi:hypothetical protein
MKFVFLSLLLLPTVNSDAIANPTETPQPTAQVGNAAACAPGVYLLDGPVETSMPIKIAESFTQRRKVDGLISFAISGGIAKMSIKTILPGVGAQTKSMNRRPRFRFCYEIAPIGLPSSVGGGSAYLGSKKASASPNEYRLIRFAVKKSDREFLLSKGGLTGNSGPNASDISRFSVVEEGPGQFLVTPETELGIGQYGFFRGTFDLSTNNAQAAKQGEQVFDFAIEAVPNSSLK